MGHCCGCYIKHSPEPRHHDEAQVGGHGDHTAEGEAMGLGFRLLPAQ